MGCVLDPARRKEYTILDQDQNPIEIQHWYLQHTFEKEEERVVEKTTERRIPTGQQRKSECRDVAKVERWKQPWGHFCVLAYAAEKVRPWWWYVLVGVGILAGVVLVVISGGALLAAKWAVTGAAGVIATFSGTVAGASLAVVIGVPEGYAPGSAPKGPEYEMDAPMGDWAKVDEDTRVLRDWYPC